jgi:hypothetical protein
MRPRSAVVDATTDDQKKNSARPSTVEAQENEKLTCTSTKNLHGDPHRRKQEQNTSAHYPHPEDAPITSLPEDVPITSLLR